MPSKRCEFFLGYVMKDMTLLARNYCAVNLALSSPPSSMFFDLTHSHGAVNLVQGFPDFLVSQELKDAAAPALIENCSAASSLYMSP